MTTAAPPGTAALRLQGRRLYLCTPDRSDLLRFVDRCIAGGVDMVQLRDKDLDARPLLRRAQALAELCTDRDVPFILNDRPDLASACGAGGVHVGQDDAPAAVCRAILGPDAIVGLSTHELAELHASVHEPVDYISAGPVTPTPTKPGRPGTGAGYLRQAVAAAGRPVFATGGVTPEAVAELAAAGVRRFVVVRYLTSSVDPEADARRLRVAIEAAGADDAAGAGDAAGADDAAHPPVAEKCW